MHGKVLERVLDGVDGASDEDRGGSDDGSEDDVRDEGLAVRLHEVRHRESGRTAAERDANARSRRGRECNRNHGARPQLEEEQLDREQHRRDRAAERGCHPGRRARREEGLPLRGGGAQHLPDEGAQRAARGDDRSFGSERTSGADGNRRRERLEQRDARGDAAAIQEHLLHRLGDPVPADGGRSVAGHQADDDPADHRDGDDPSAEPIGGGTRVLRAETAVEGEVGDEPDEAGENLGDRARGGRDDDREQADEDHAAVDERALGRYAGRRQRAGHRRRHR